MKSKQQNPVKLIILFVIMIGLIVGYYFYLSNKTAEAKEAKQTVTETDEVLLRNLSTDYPPSPKEVVKYYAQITKCFYDGNYTEDQLSKMAEKSRELFDEELRDTQSDADYLVSLKKDIAEYGEKGLKVSSFSTSSSVDVEYKKTEQGDMASLYCLFNLRQGTTILTSNQMFLLRKDTEGHWKILGWTLVTD